MTGVIVPNDARMVTGGIGYTYAPKTTMPLTQTDVPGYPFTPLVWTGVGTFTAGGGQGGVTVPAPNATVALSGTLPTTLFSTAQATAAKATRRAIVTNSKCNDCHAVLGVFTGSVYHAGQRNDAPTCTFCHNVNKANAGSGWGANIKDAVHSLHAGGMRANNFSWEASAGDKYWDITYPGFLNDCEACHVPGSYDFSNSTNAAAIPNLLWTTSTAGYIAKVGDYVSGTSGPTIAYVGAASDALDFRGVSSGGTGVNIAVAPWVTPGTTYGNAYSAAIAATGATITPAQANSLVTSPIAAACVACHDAPLAIAHIKGNGGSFNAPRPAAGTLPSQAEQCLICHGTGTIADIKTVHMNF